METILVATDFSKPANGAVEYAAHLARYFSARLVIVNAFRLPVQGYNSFAPLNLASEFRTDSENKLHLVRDHLIRNSYDFGIETTAEPGDAVTVVNGIVNRQSVDLVVVGMTGEGSALKEKLIGSTSVSLAKKLKVPVLIVPERHEYRSVRRISLACELEHVEESTLIYFARAFARLFDAELEIVTVEESTNKEPAHSPDRYSFIDKKLQGIKHRNVLLHERSKTLALEYYFKFHETDMVIVNFRKHNVFKSIFSESVTKHLAFHCRVPLLVLQ